MAKALDLAIKFVFGVCVWGGFIALCIEYAVEAYREKKDG